MVTKFKLNNYFHAGHILNLFIMILCAGVGAGKRSINTPYFPILTNTLSSVEER